MTTKVKEGQRYVRSDCPAHPLTQVCVFNTSQVQAGEVRPRHKTRRLLCHLVNHKQQLAHVLFHGGRQGCAESGGKKHRGLTHSCLIIDPFVVFTSNIMFLVRLAGI